MLGYIISDKENIDDIDIKNHEIKSFDILHKTNLNIFVVENNKILYKNIIIDGACVNNHTKILEWYKNSGYEFKYDKYMINSAFAHGHIEIIEWFKKSGYKIKYTKHVFYYILKNKYYKVLEFFKNINVKKVIKWSKPLKFKKTIKFKTKNNYIKGYNKN